MTVNEFFHDVGEMNAIWLIFIAFGMVVDQTIGWAIVLFFIVVAWS